MCVCVCVYVNVLSYKITADAKHVPVVLSVKKHVIVRCNQKTDVAEEAIATTVNELQDVLHHIQGAPIKNNPLEKILYLRNCSRFFHQIYADYKGGFRPCIQQIAFKYLV